MKVRNKSNKIIGIGEVNVLPDAFCVVPEKYENSIVIETYERLGFIEIVEAAKTKTEAETAEEQRAMEESRKAEELAKAEERKARLATVDAMDEEALASLAIEVGVNPAECKDIADVKKKVKAALKK